MARAASTLLLALLLAGCATRGAVTADPPTAAATAAPLAFTASVDILGGGRGYEPSIDVAPDGTLVVTAARTPGEQRSGASSWLRYSKDGGATWADVPSPAQLHALLPAAEGDTAIDAQGRLYFVDTYLLDNTISRWRITEGEPRWESSLPMQGTPYLDDRPWLAAHGDGVVYFLGNNAGSYVSGVQDGAMWFYRSEDAGATWTLGDAFPATGWCNLAASPADDVTVLAACYRPSEESLVAFLSRDRGASFVEASAGPLARAGANFPAVAFDAGGAPYAAWIDGVYWEKDAEALRVSRLHGDEWEPVDITPFEGSMGFVAVAGGAPGTLAVLFYGAETTTVDASTEWYGHVVLTRNAMDETPTWQSARFDPLPVAVGGEPNPDFFQAAFGPDGTLHVAYGRQAGGPTGQHLLDRIADEILHVALPPPASPANP